MLLRPLVLAVVAAALAACAGAGATARVIPRRPPPPPKVPWVAYPEAEVKGAKNAHDHKGAPLCQRCHVAPDEKLVKPEPALCFDCHPAQTMTHVGKLQKPPPATLPYEEGGRITCHTCHEPHDVKAHPFGFRQDYVPLCLECHKGH